VCAGSDAIGITANFVNTQTPEEKQLDEFGLLSIYNQVQRRIHTSFDLLLFSLIVIRG
jgi:hypothetical protein